MEWGGRMAVQRDIDCISQGVLKDMSYGGLNDGLTTKTDPNSAAAAISKWQPKLWVALLLIAISIVILGCQPSTTQPADAASASDGQHGATQSIESDETVIYLGNIDNAPQADHLSSSPSAIFTTLSLTTNKDGNLSGCQAQTTTANPTTSTNSSTTEATSVSSNAENSKNPLGTDASADASIVIIQSLQTLPQSSHISCVINDTPATVSRDSDRLTVHSSDSNTTEAALATPSALSPVQVDNALLQQITGWMQGQPQLYFSINRYDRLPLDSIAAIMPEATTDAHGANQMPQRPLLVLISGATQTQAEQFADVLRPLLNEHAQLLILPSVAETTQINQRNANALAAIHSLKQSSSTTNPASQPDRIQLQKALNAQVVNFASASSEIPAINRQILSQAIPILRHLPKYQLLIRGHTDSSGHSDQNRRLSKQRAEAVKAFLVAGGLDEQRIATQGVGDDEPIASNATADGRWQNRRIEFVLQ